MPNENCLEGISCPHCGFEDRFFIEGRAVFEVLDDGTEDQSDIDWISPEDGGTIRCADCNHVGDMDTFTQLSAQQRHTLVSEIFTRCMKDPKYLENFITARTQHYGQEEYNAIFGAYKEEEDGD